MKRFWDKVDKSGDCWVWMASIDSSGYGHLGIDGKTARAHRVSWVLAHGPVPDGLYVLHRCDNRKCVNPEHLFLGTHSDNMRDMKVKGRQISRCGEAHPLAGMTDATAWLIKGLRRAGFSLQELSKRFEVSVPVISSIANGRTWRHVQ